MAIAIFERWGLNPREQRMASGAVIVLSIMLVGGLVFGVSASVSSRTNEIEELRNTLALVQAGRGQVHERQSRKDSLAMRYGQHAPALAGYLEETARKHSLEVTDSLDHPEVPRGKKFTERSTVIHLKKAGMLNIAKFLEAIEKSPYPLSVSRLNIRKRTGEADSYDVEVGVSAYDRDANATSPNSSNSSGSSSSTPDKKP